jgi:hypothetical protein
MKLVILAALLIGVPVAPSLTLGQASCPAVVEANVEVAMGEFSLADLLAPSTCPELLRAASRVRLGRAPLPGTVRVLDGNEVRIWLRNVTADVDNLGGSANLQVPERVSVRRAGARADCADIVGRILASPDAHPVRAESGMHGVTKLDAGEASTSATNCGAAGRILQEARFELTRKVWNPMLGTWDLFARCLKPGDCVPFLVRVPSRDFPAEVVEPAGMVPSAISVSPAASVPSAKAPITPRPGTALVRPGETVSLLWDQDGIRLVVPAVSLDAGGPGESVRARIARGGRVVHAIVVSAGQLRAAS